LNPTIPPQYIQALAIWVCLSLPSIVVTLALYAFPADIEDEDKDDDDDGGGEGGDNGQEEVTNVSYTCYENYTIYHPMYLEVRFDTYYNFFFKQTFFLYNVEDKRKICSGCENVVLYM
jgi:hypothetical protein